MSALLPELKRLHRSYGSGLADSKSVLLDALATHRLPTARSVQELHEILCFLRAYPDSTAVLTRVERMLARFAGRPDLRRHATALMDTGIDGTPTFYSFFYPTAQWLATRYPSQLTVSWEDLEHPERLERILHLLGLHAETPGFDELALPIRDWIRRMKGPGETDAVFLLRRMAAVKADVEVREAVFEDIGIMFKLAAGPETPNRTREYLPRKRVHFVTRPLETTRPDLRRVLRGTRPAITAVAPDEGQSLIDLARAAMVARARDLDAFAYGDPNDVRVIDCGHGLEFVAVGLVPERRLLLEAVYGFLTLMNGAPIGYVLNSALYGSAEVAFNVFDTFRGAEAARVYGQTLAVLKHLFGATAFTIYPYQLGGAGNKEGLHSGAWWFYQKLGFRPEAPEALRLMEAELARMRKIPGHRSSRATLRLIAEYNMYYHIGRSRPDVIGKIPLPNVGLAVTDMLAQRFGADRERAETVLEREMVRLLGVGTRRGWTDGEKLGFRRWAPLAATLPGVADWPLTDRRALAEVMRAKGGQRESDFVLRFDAHRRLRRALVRLARETD